MEKFAFFPEMNSDLDYLMCTKPLNFDLFPELSPEDFDLNLNHKSLNEWHNSDPEPHFQLSGFDHLNPNENHTEERPEFLRCASPAKKVGRTLRNSNCRKINGKSGKLWEFLIGLLQDPRTCPQLITWVNFEEGMFKFVKSHKVARIWGDRKQNSNMTYEKFSRAMRYYYKSEILLPVPGQKLVYKFGPSAKGWKDIEPIF